MTTFEGPIKPAPEPNPPEEWDGVLPCPRCDGRGCAPCGWTGMIEVEE